jgi:hypothetical protein
MLKDTLFAVLVLIIGLVPSPLPGQTAQARDEILQTAVVLSGDEATLDLELASGRSLQIRFSNGIVYVGGSEAGRYEPGGTLESAWRAFLRSTSEGEFNGALAGLAGAAAELEADEAAVAVIAEALAPFLAEVSSEVADAIAEAAAASAAAAAAYAASAQLEGLEEIVEGGLVVELAELDGLARSLGRIGLTSELEHLLSRDLDGPVRIVIEADDYLLPAGAELGATLILVETDAVVAGKIAGDVLVADGNLLITPSGMIEGDVIGVDANVRNQGTIVGDLRSVEGFAPIVVAPSARRVRIRGEAPTALSSLWSGLGSLAKTIAMYLLFGFLGALIVYFFRNNLETVSDTVSLSFGRSFLTGLAAEVLFLPIGLVMMILIVTAIAVPFYALAFALLGLLGYMGVAHAAGENLTRRRFSWSARMRRSNSYYYVLNGLGVLLALFVGASITEMAYPLLGWAHDLLIASAWILTWIAATSGLGAALLSRAGTQLTYARPRELPALPIDTLVGEMEPIEARAGARRRTEEGAGGQ